MYIQLQIRTITARITCLIVVHPVQCGSYCTMWPTLYNVAHPVYVAHPV